MVLPQTLLIQLSQYTGICVAQVEIYLISEGNLDELERVVSCPDRYYDDINHY